MQKLKDSNKMLIFKVKRKNGQVWAQTKEHELQKRATISYAQQALSQLQQESGTEMDTLVSGVKKIQAYGGKKDIIISVRGCGICLICWR
jgi:hypothetical protein